MSKIAKVFLIIAGALVLAGIVFCAISFSRIDWRWDRISEFVDRGRYFNHENGDMSAWGAERKELSFDAAEVEKLVINTVIDDVKIHTTTASEQITVVYYNYENYTHEAKLIDNTLQITTRTPRGSWFNWFDWFNWGWDEGEDLYKIEVWLPTDISETLAIEVDNSSGDIEIADLIFAKLVASSVSGEIDLEHCQIAEMKLTASSGNISAENVTGATLQAETVSGEIDLAECQITDNRLNTSSGNVELENLKGEKLYTSTVSGDIGLDNCSVAEMDMESASGTIRLNDCTLVSLSANLVSGDFRALLYGSSSEYQIKASSISGDIRCDRGADSSNQLISIDTTSGDIDLDFHH